MVIDFHTHIFPDKIAGPTLRKLSAVSHVPPFTTGTAEGLKRSMEDAGVDLSVILPVATNPRQVTGINTAAAEGNQQTPGLLSFGCIHPDCPDCREELARVERLGLKGIKIHPVYQDTPLDDPQYLRILDRAGELGLLVCAHCGIDLGFPEKEYATPAMLRRAMDQVGPIDLVAAHMGGWKNWEEAEALLADTPVRFDTACSTGLLTVLNDGHYTPEERKLLNEEAFLRLVRLFGAHRILFGSDSPWSGQREGVLWLRALPLPPEEIEAILGENGRKLLDL